MFGEAHPGVPMIVASLVPEPFRLGPIEVLPSRRFLARLDDWI